MEVGGVFGVEEVEDAGGVGFGVEDGEGTGVLSEVVGEFVVREWLVFEGDIGSFEGVEEGTGVGDYFVFRGDGEGYSIEGLGEVAGLVGRETAEGGLGCGAENNCAVGGCGELFEKIEAGGEMVGGEGLGFIENDDGAGKVVELAAARGFLMGEGFKELNVGGDNEGSVPVFREKFMDGDIFGVFGFRWVEIGVMF